MIDQPQTRRELFGLGTASAALLAAPALAQHANPIANGRPVPSARGFRSPAVEAAIARCQAALGPSPVARKLAMMVERCLPNTLDTTVQPGTRDGRPDTFVITGDIEAMWLRDSSAQVWPYLRFLRDDPALARLIAGVINRQTACILIDPYANAFNKGPTGSQWISDKTDMKPELHERKYEIDSLCYPIRLAHGYWQATGDAAPFDAAWVRASRAIVDTFRVQQRKTGPGPYHFQRVTPVQSDTAANAGYGNPSRPVGLIVSGFRPSDDACVLPYLIPSNMFAVVSLRQLAELHRQPWGDKAIAADAAALANEVEAAIAAHAIVDHPRHGRIYAYEVDGYGGRILMDDANVPNLISLPYLGWCKPADPLYRATRAFALGADNPWYFRGRAAEGIGSPHTGTGRIWPIAIIMRALTSGDEAEIRACLHQLATTDAGTGFLHEGFDRDDPATYSRPWFAWANTLFGELLVALSIDRPGLLRTL